MRKTLIIGLLLGLLALGSTALAEPPHDKCPKGEWQYDTDSFGLPMCAKHGDRPITIPMPDHPKAERPRGRTYTPPIYPQPLPSVMPKSDWHPYTPNPYKKKHKETESERQERLQEMFDRQNNKSSATCFINSMF